MMNSAFGIDHGDVEKAFTPIAAAGKKMANAGNFKGVKNIMAGKKPSKPAGALKAFGTKLQGK